MKTWNYIYNIIRGTRTFKWWRTSERSHVCTLYILYILYICVITVITIIITVLWKNWIISSSTSKWKRITINYYFRGIRFWGLLSTLLRASSYHAKYTSQHYLLAGIILYYIHSYTHYTSEYNCLLLRLRFDVRNCWMNYICV